jgi:hypothetical protein
MMRNRAHPEGLTLLDDDRQIQKPISSNLSEDLEGTEKETHSAGFDSEPEKIPFIPFLLFKSGIVVGF